MKPTAIMRLFLPEIGKWPGKVLLLTALIGLGAGLYLSCRPSPAFSTIRWLPHWFSKWADRHGVFRNFPAYALLATPFLILTRNHAGQRAGIMIFLAILAAALEVVQLWIPPRVADVKDVLTSWAGLLAVWGLFEAGLFLCRKRSAEPQENQSRL